MSKEESNDYFNQQKIYANIARAYFKKNNIYKYRMKKIEDMDDEEVIQKCHWWYEENNFVKEYLVFEEMMLSIH